MKNIEKVIEKNQINFYCDESRHIENDPSRFMVLGTVYGFSNEIENVNKRIKQIKESEGLNPYTEMKWSKLSNCNLKAYKLLIEYFLNHTSLAFRSIIIDKDTLDHKKHKHTHEDFYYIMYYYLLDRKITQLVRNKIYMDEKDTRNKRRVMKLQEIFNKRYLDPDKNIVAPIQVIKSHTIQIMQLTDILTGAISYALNDKERKSKAKVEIIELIEDCLKCKITDLRSIQTKKIDLFFFKPHEEV